MKITGFCPLIVTKDPEAVMKVFEELGFERRHTKTDIEGGTVTNFSMKDANGFRINIAASQNMEKDLTSMSMNVDNFQEAYDFLISKGYVNPRGDKVTDTSSSRATMLISPSGFPITISEHIKKDKE
ncbi:hypothetical protein BXO88_12220 [Oribacterium sp. C9]|uniref:VOC family protein n=1 Tax=Oribacterium sp. C9 TaxID=1943579 RepID=UPI00098FCC70|nr:hypothetical protein [Oribacterium sp. C9]OON85420.1 hypothetical protein BXO88_12220 [Oribacterium sp. C9]